MKNTRKDFLAAASDHKIICFGAGKILEQVAAFLYSNHLKIDILVDNAREMRGKNSEGCEIQSPNILGKCDGEIYIVIISSKNYAREIYNQINGLYPNKFMIFKWPLEIEEGVVFDEQLWSERIYGTCMSTYKEIAKNRKDASKYIKEKEILLRDKEKLILPRTPLMITTRCTLCCKECSNLMPYYSFPKDYESNEIIQWIKNISSVVDEWACCELVGGEPF